MTAQPAGSSGYTFPLMLIIVSAMAFGASRIELAEGYRLQRDKEEELLFRGRAYIHAIQAFHQKNNRYPRELAELADGKGPARHRFIRQLYKDPITGKDFNAIPSQEGTVIGVVSSSQRVPFRKGGFETRWKVSIR